MSFALVHAGLGWLFAALAAWALRRRSADARCWAWRFGLLKGPLALLLAVPLVFVPPILSSGQGLGVVGKTNVRSIKPAFTPARSSPLTNVTAMSERSRSGLLPFGGGQCGGASTPASLPSVHPSPLAPSLFPVTYVLGVASVLLARFAAARRTHRPMPRVVGVLRPRVVIPDGLAPEDAEIALLHESAHIRRRDPQWSLVADLVCAALWFAPPVWLCARAMRLESEAACDAAALHETGAPKAAYARLLLAFAGPAPALALGGPARRLARRILMLEHTPKPLPRLAVAALIMIGLAALLPWRAEARPSVPATKVEDQVPARTSLRTASLRLLREPGVRDELRLSDAQRATLVRPILMGNLRLLAQRRRDAVSNLKKFPAGSRHPMAQANRIELAAVVRNEAETRRRLAEPTVPLTEMQARTLAARALDRFGSAVWEDARVASALVLDAEQLAAAQRENDKIAAAQRADHSLGEFQYAADRTASELRRGGLTSAQRKAKERSIEGYRDMAARFRASFQERSPAFWRMRGAADVRLESLLKDDQRQRLEALRRTPEAWPRLPDPTAGETPRHAPLVAHGALEAGERALGTLTASARKISQAGDRTTYSGDVAVDGEALDPLPSPAGTRTPVKVVTEINGTAWNVYRDGDRPPYRYTVEHVSATKPTTILRGAPHLVRRIAVSHWNSLAVDGPALASGESRSRRDPEGSTWNLARNQNGDYSLTLRIETSATEFPNREVPATPPATLTIQGETWTLHPSKGNRQTIYMLGAPAATRFRGRPDHRDAFVRAPASTVVSMPRDALPTRPQP